MITSMTGFAALTREDERATVSVTVRAVNHRFLDVQLRLPQSLADREARIRALVQQAVARGRIELGVSVQLRQAAVPHVELNEAFVTALEAALERARLRGVIAGHLTPGDLLRLPHAITIREQPAVPDSGTSEAIGAGGRSGRAGRAGRAGPDARPRRAAASAGPRRAPTGDGRAHRADCRGGRGRTAEPAGAARRCACRS